MATGTGKYPTSKTQANSPMPTAVEIPHLFIRSRQLFRRRQNLATDSQKGEQRRQSLSGDLKTRQSVETEIRAYQATADGRGNTRHSAVMVTTSVELWPTRDPQ